MNTGKFNEEKKSNNLCDMPWVFVIIVWSLMGIGAGRLIELIVNWVK